MSQYKLVRNSVRKAQKILGGKSQFSSLRGLKRKKKKGNKRYGQKADRLRLAREQQNEKVVCNFSCMSLCCICFLYRLSRRNSQEKVCYVIISLHLLTYTQCRDPVFIGFTFPSGVAFTQCES